MLDIPSTQRAAQVGNASGGLDKTIRIDEIPIPTELKEGQFLVKVAYSSLNPIDYKIPESIASYAFRSPFIPGLDFSGTVIKRNGKKFNLGQRVAGNIGSSTFGALAEYIVVGGEGIVAIPNGVSLAQAATIGAAGLTAYQSIVPLAPRKVFINGGSGGTGSFGIQIAKAIGAYVVTSCSTANVQLVKKLGADDVIDYRTQDLVTELSKHQFDLIVDNVFSTVDIYWASDRFLKPGKPYINIGGEITWAAVIRVLKVFLVPGFLGGGKRTFSMLSIIPKEEDYAAILEYIKDGKVKPLIDQEFDFADIGAAFTKLKTGRAKGKIVIKISGEP